MYKRLSSIAFPVVLLALLLSACGDSQTFVVTADTNVEAAITVDQKEGQVGKPVHITFTVTHTGRVKTGKPEILESNPNPVMDIRAGYATDDFARWSAQNPDQVFHRLVLEPGQSRTVELT